MGRKRGREGDLGRGGTQAATLQTALAAPSLSAKWRIHNWESVVRKRSRQAPQWLRAEWEGAWASGTGRRERVSAGRRPPWSFQELEE